MLFGVRGGPLTDLSDGRHAGYVAGRYRSGAWSDHWTDVGRCAERTFTDFAPACTCGWRGVARPATAEGQLACQREAVFGHLPRPAPQARPV